MPPQSTSRKTQRVLIVWPGREPPEVLEALSEHAPVRTVHDVDEAVAELKSQRFALVVAEPGQLLLLAQALGQQRSDLILERIGQGICVTGPGGELIWANAKLKAYPQPVLDAVLATCREVAAEFPTSATPDASITRPIRVNVGQELYFDVVASPLSMSDGRVQELVALVSDVTAARRLQEKIAAIDAAGRELIRLDPEALSKMDIAERLEVLEDRVIRAGRELLHFDHFVVRVLDRKTNRLEPLLASGLSEEARALPIYASPERNGISGFVAATGRSYICADVSKDPCYLPGLEGARSSLTVPLLLHDQVVGILNVESDQLNAFNDNDRQFAEIFGRYIAMALHILQLLAIERHTTTGQIAADVAAEMSAPLSDISAECAALIRSPPPPERLAPRIEAILGKVQRVHQAIRSVTEGVAAGESGAPMPPDPLIENRRILVAEDEEIIRQITADVLTRVGAIVTVACDGDEAIAALRSQPFDLVLSDIKMPHRTGYEVFAAARQAHPGCPVILITGFGYDPNHSIVRASKEGLAGVLFKPFKVEQLLNEVRHALRSVSRTPECPGSVATAGPPHGP